MKELLIIAISSALVSNVVLSQFLGIKTLLMSSLFGINNLLHFVIKWIASLKLSISQIHRKSYPISFIYARIYFSSDNIRNPSSQIHI